MRSLGTSIDCKRRNSTRMGSAYLPSSNWPRCWPAAFSDRVSKPDLQQLVSRALSELDFSSIEAIKTLPGMVNAVCRSLHKAWSAGLISSGGGRNVANPWPT